MIRALALTFAALAVGCGTTNRPSPTNLSTRWVGCYTLNRGEWDSVPEPVLRDLPGPTLQLLGSRGQRSGFYAGPELPADQHLRRAKLGRDRGALWWVVSPDSIVVTTLGLAGVTLYLEKDPTGALSGQAATFTDILRPGPRDTMNRWVTVAPLAGSRTRCP